MEQTCLQYKNRKSSTDPLPSTHPYLFIPLEKAAALLLSQQKTIFEKHFRNPICKKDPPGRKRGSKLHPIHIHNYSMILVGCHLLCSLSRPALSLIPLFFFFFSFKLQCLPGWCIAVISLKEDRYGRCRRRYFRLALHPPRNKPLASKCVSPCSHHRPCILYRFASKFTCA